MKIYAVADIHGSQYRMNILLKNVERYSPDVVVICGDITQFGPGDVAKNFLNQINVETVAVTGNIDSEDVKKSIDDSNATRIELKKVVKKGIKFVGANGTKDSDFDFLRKKELVDSDSVVVTHVPPKGMQDKISIGIKGGNKIFRKIVDDFKPRLVLCGHVHENPGFTKNDDTIVVNCSMGNRGEGALIDINKSINVEMLD